MSLTGNLFARMVAVLLIGFISFQLLIVAATTLPSRGSAERPYNLPRPAEAAAMLDAIDRAPATQRPALIRAFNSGLYRVTLTDGVRASANPTTDDLVGLGRFYAAAMPRRAVAVDARRAWLGAWIGTQPRPARFFAPVTITISLADGSALAIASQPSPAISRFLRWRSLLGALAGCTLLVVIVLALRQITRPLARLARGVRGMGEALEAPDLPVQGPREVRALAEALNAMNGRVRALMAERTRMLAAIAHDMRTYLTRMRLRAEYVSDPDQQERAVRDLDEMTALLDDTLLLARADAPDAGPQQLVELGAVAAEALARREGDGGRISFSGAGRSLPVQARPAAIRRILDNLVDNALRHASAATVTLERRDGHAVLAVSDNGPGMTAELAARVGEPFLRGEPSRSRDHGGAGLGLAIVHALAARDGGTLALGRSDAGGLRAEVAFPIAR